RGNGKSGRACVQTRRRHPPHPQQHELLMWQLIAIVLIAIIWFYLGAIYLTVVAWLNAVGPYSKATSPVLRLGSASAWECCFGGMVQRRSPTLGTSRRG